MTSPSLQTLRKPDPVSYIVFQPRLEGRGDWHVLDTDEEGMMETVEGL